LKRVCTEPLAAARLFKLQSLVLDKFFDVKDFSYVQGGGVVVWSTADEPNLPLVAAKNPNIVRWYQEDQVLDIVFSEPMQLNQVSEAALRAGSELRDLLDGRERVVAVVIQRPYMRQVYVPCV